MKVKYKEPEPVRYEYRAVEIATGKVLFRYKAPAESDYLSCSIVGVPRSAYRVEVHPIEEAPEDAIKEKSDG